MALTVEHFTRTYAGPAGSTLTAVDDLSFEGPIDTFHKAEPYLAAIQGLSKIVKRVDVKKCLLTETTCACCTIW